MGGLGAGNNENVNKNDNKEIKYITKDATKIIERYGITAKDLTIGDAPENIKSWVNECNKNQGAYMMKSQTLNGYITYIYYNGGGRYSWNINVEDDRIIINLFSDSSLATDDGFI